LLLALLLTLWIFTTEGKIKRIKIIIIIIIIIICKFIRRTMSALSKQAESEALAVARWG